MKVIKTLEKANTEATLKVNLLLSPGINLKCKIIAGGANNQLLDASIAENLLEKDIVFIPDTLINSGGVIGLTKDYLKRDDAETEQALRDIASRVKALMIESQDKSISIYQALNNRSL